MAKWIRFLCIQWIHFLKGLENGTWFYGTLLLAAFRKKNVKKNRIYASLPYDQKEEEGKNLKYASNKADDNDESKWKLKKKT